ncbi:hypothetical protein B0O99DRAFT_683309 [Bisporella sp. PMI_857]|nr:hypothetical protein B0O99DRAFT_683309 [Bisporella sp. PMI_857]
MKSTMDIIDGDLQSLNHMSFAYIQSSAKLNTEDWASRLAPDFPIKTIYSGTNSANSIVVPEPYFVQSSTINVSQTYKLHVNTAQALIQDPYGTHHTLRATLSSAGGHTVAVPSRLYFNATAEKLLACLRIAMKDLYDLKGLETSGGSRLTQNVIITQIAYPIYEQWNGFGRDFVATYQSTHNGDFPHMSPRTRDGWSTPNETMTEDTREKDLIFKLAIANWTLENSLVLDKVTCSSAITANPYISDLISTLTEYQLLLLRSNATLNCNTTLVNPEACGSSLTILYNATATSTPTVFPGRLATLADVSNYVITLGSFNLGDTTFSNSTLKSQSLPLPVNIIAANGCDFMILNIIEELHEKGVVTTVRTGNPV